MRVDSVIDILIGKIKNLPITQAINDLKKQLSKNDSTIFSSLVLIATGPRFFGMMIFSRYLCDSGLCNVLTWNCNSFADLPVHINEVFGQTFQF